MIQLADELLERDGRLVAAVDALGVPSWEYELAPFSIPRSFG
jgi:predicted protein tyrosine phosphatase